MASFAGQSFQGQELPSNPVDEIVHFVKSMTSSIPKVTKALCIIISVSTIVSCVPILGEWFVKLFGLVAGSTLGKMFLWNIISFAFVEVSVIQCVVSVLALITLGKMVEPLWTSVEMVKFILFAVGCSGIVTFAFTVFRYIVTNIDSVLFDPVVGSSPVLAAFVVAIKQTSPDLDFLLFGNFRVTSSYLIGVYLAFYLLLVIIQSLSLQEFVAILASSYFAWFYLRYVQDHGDHRGDASESFALHTFFPPPASAVVLSFTTIISSVLGKTVGTLQAVSGPVTAIKRTTQAAAPNVVSSNAAEPYLDANSLDSERRRSRALKSLEERIMDDGSSKDGSEV